MKVYKLVSYWPHTRPHPYYSAIVDDASRLTYTVDKPTIAPKGTPGIAAFKTFKDAKAFSWGGGDGLKLFIAEATPIDTVSHAPHTCQVCSWGRLMDAFKPGCWPPGTILCSTLTLKYEV